MAIRTLFRPVGLQELALIYDMDFRGFPPRLPHQPIFYPVLNRDYAIQIARDWNTPDEDSGYAGFVTAFDVDARYLSRFEEQTVGGRVHKELWVPAEELQDFNGHIAGAIRLTDAFFGPRYEGYIPERFGLRSRNAVDQFISLARLLEYNGADFLMEASANAKAVYLNAPFCVQHDFRPLGLSPEQCTRVLHALRTAWQQRHADVPFSI